MKEGEAKVEQAESAPAKKDEPSAAQPNPAKSDQKVDKKAEEKKVE